MISSIELRNFRKHKNTKVSFGPGVVGIIGKNESGKTTLFAEGLPFCLYGIDALRDGKGDVSSYDTKGVAFAKVSIEVSGTNYEIGRSLQTAVFKIDGQENSINGIGPVNKAVVDAFKMNLKAFELGFLCKQAEVNLISTLRAGERKQYILRMLGVDRLDSKVIPGVKDVRDGLQGQVDAIPVVDINPVKVHMETVEQEIKILWNSIVDGEREVKSLQAEIAGYNSSIQVLEKQAKKHSDCRERLAAVTAEILSYKARIDGCATEMNELRGKIDEERIRLLESCLSNDQLVVKEKELKGMDKAELAWKAGLSRIAKLNNLIVRKEELESWLGMNPKKDEEPLSKELGNAQEVERNLAGDIAKAYAKCQSIISTGKQTKAKRDAAQNLGKGSCPTCYSDISPDSVQRVVAAFDKELDTLRANNSAAKAEHEALSSRQPGAIAKVKELFNAHQDIVNYNRKRKEREEEVRELGRQIFELQGDNIEYSADAHSLLRTEVANLKAWTQELSGFMSNVNKLSRVIAGRDSLVADDKKLSMEHSELTAKITEFADVEDKLKTARMHMVVVSAKVSGLEGDIRGMKSSLKGKEELQVELKRQLDLANENMVKLKELAGELSIYNKLLDALKSFRIYLIGKIRPTLESYGTDILAEITDYDRVSIDEDYEIFLVKEKVSVPFRSLSTGAQTLVSLCLRLAIARMICEANAVPLDFIVLDEPTAYLDDERQVAIIEKIMGLKEVFKQVFIISHQKELLRFVDQIILVDDGKVKGSL